MWILVSLLIVVVTLGFCVYLLHRMDEEKLNKLFGDMNKYYPPDYWY